MVSAAAVFVAQTASLLYRRMPSCRTAPWPERLDFANALPIGNRRYSRLTICATTNQCGIPRNCDLRSATVVPSARRATQAPSSSAQRIADTKARCIFDADRRDSGEARANFDPWPESHQASRAGREQSEGISDKVTSAASTECLLPLPATEEWGEGKPCKHCKKTISTVSRRPSPWPSPRFAGREYSWRGVVQPTVSSVRPLEKAIRTETTVDTDEEVRMASRE